MQVEVFARRGLATRRQDHGEATGHKQGSRFRQKLHGRLVGAADHALPRRARKGAAVPLHDGHVGEPPLGDHFSKEGAPLLAAFHHGEPHRRPVNRQRDAREPGARAEVQPVPRGRQARHSGVGVEKVLIHGARAHEVHDHSPGLQQLAVHTERVGHAAAVTSDGRLRR